MTGAHYETLRRLSLSDTLPQVSDLRNLLRQVWENTGAASAEEEIKRFPIRIINAGVRDTSVVLVKLVCLSHLKLKLLPMN